MALGKKTRSEHGGAKNSSAKGGFWGYHHEAKWMSRRVRRRAVEEGRGK
jgi:hypothetical protein